MKIAMVGCSHHNASIEIREQISFNRDQVPDALAQFRIRFPETEAVLVSTCNRVELYFACEHDRDIPSHHDVVEFLSAYHDVNSLQVFDDLFERSSEDAVRHLFTVASSLDSMVVGEAQILAQVKQAYEQAGGCDCAGPILHSLFQAAIRVAKRVASETAIHQKRVSIPSVAIADFASQIFERFDNKKVLVIGAGDMGEETLRYLIDSGARDVTITNRNRQRAERLADDHRGRVGEWDQLEKLLIEADLVISTTGATQPVVTRQMFERIEAARYQRPIFILDLAVPRDFEPAIGDFVGVYLYAVDDLKKACEANRRAREKDWPKAEKIIEEESAAFLAELYHRPTGPTIRRLKALADQLKQEEISRLMNKLDGLSAKERREVERAFDRLTNKLLHPPLESLRDQSQNGTPHSLLEALRTLFQLKD